MQHQQAKFGEKNRDVKNKIPEISGLTTAAVLNTKVTKVEKI